MSETAGLAITEEQAALAATARRFLEARCPREVARAALDAETESMPEFWPDLAALGWPGLHIDAAFGGEGYGFEELAVVTEEMGRAGAPGPFLATVLAGALIQAGGSQASKQRWLPGLASGKLVGAAALSCDPGAPVLSAGLADVVVLPLDGAWWALPAAGARVTVMASLDPTRRVAEVTTTGPLPEDARLDLDGDHATALGAVLVAAECAGAAGWCLDTAAAYAKVREQFGRPIGQFQAVKHRCAAMLVSLEQIRAAAWDAAAAVDAGDHPLAAAVAGAVAAPLFLEVAKDCVQILGGIGFTWEHDAHRYLRRAATLVALTGGAAPWRRKVAAFARAGVRRRSGAGGLAGHDELRARVREQVDAVASLPAERRHEALVDAGLYVAHWPEPWGRSAGAAEQIVVDEELRRAGLHRRNMGVGAWAAPTIALHGTPEQRDRWVRPTLVGEITWCQLFSEPGAGSDLASLTTRAKRCDGGWSLSGQKVWTSLAAQAQWGICLARTDPEAPKHLGITYFVVDMSRPGITVRPLREMTGFAMFNEVFLDAVFVPDGDVIGEVGGGWALARTTLANERVAMGSGASFGGGMEALLDLVAGLGELDPVAADRLGELVCEAHCLSVMGRRIAHRALAGAGPGPEASVRKLLGAEHDQAAQELGLWLLGPAGATTGDGPPGQWTFGFLANRCLTIAGGTSEVQRNVIAERLLGLPRDPPAAAG